MEDLKSLVQSIRRGRELLLSLEKEYRWILEVNPYPERRPSSIYYYTKKLEELGLVECKKVGKRKFCRLTELGAKLKEYLARDL